MDRKAIWFTISSVGSSDRSMQANFPPPTTERLRVDLREAPCISSLKDAIVQVQIQSVVAGPYAIAYMQELRASEA